MIIGIEKNPLPIIIRDFAYLIPNQNWSWNYISVILFSSHSNKSTISSAPIKIESFKNISKAKQLKVFITNRSFVITNKYSIPDDFYQQWEEGKMHKNTKNCRIIC